MNQALVVGIDLYATQSLLEGCVNDAVDLARILRSRAVEVVVLLDIQATKHAIVMELAALVQALGPGDTGYVHFSGHGVRMQAPRGVDEVLCPHDFAWTRETAISDRELIEILSDLDPEARLFVTIDASHAGDFLRGAGLRGRPRTLTPPNGVVVRGPTDRGLRALAELPNIAVVAACSAWETAADTELDGRANGAFTYWFLSALERVPTATIAEIVAAIAVPLRDYLMTPVAINADVVYLAEGGYATPLRRLPPVDDVVYERCWNASLLDQPFEIDLVMMQTDADLFAYVVTGQLGGTMTSSPIRIAGNTRVPIELGFFGVQIVVTITEWTGSEFVLQVDLESNLAFVPKTCIAREAIVLDFEVSAPSASLVDLLAQRAFTPRMLPSPSPARPSTSPSAPSAPPAYRRRSGSP